MSEVASRELRNETASVLRRASAGEEITITVNGKAVALLTAVPQHPRRWLGRDELLRRVSNGQADPGLRADLLALAGDTTDDVDLLQ